MSLDKDEGVELVTAAIEAIKQKIESLGGTLDVKHAVCLLFSRWLRPCPSHVCQHGGKFCCRGWGIWCPWTSHIRHTCLLAQLSLFEGFQPLCVLCTTQARAVNASEENKSWEDEAKDLSAENSQGEDDDDEEDDENGDE